MPYSVSASSEIQALYSFCEKVVSVQPHLKLFLSKRMVRISGTSKHYGTRLPRRKKKKVHYLSHYLLSQFTANTDGSYAVTCHITPRCK